MPNTRQQEAREWLSVLSRGLGIALGFSGVLYEFGFDQLRHPGILLALFTAMGVGTITVPIWQQFISWLAKTNHLTLTLGPIRLEMTQAPHPEETPTTIRIPGDLPALATPTSLSPASRQSDQRDADTQTSPPKPSE